MKKLRVGRHVIDVPNPDKRIFPKSKISKLELMEYYARIAPMMMPYFKKRPISMQRFPDGIGHEGFYQKDASPYFPSWIKRVDVPKQDGDIVHYVVCENAATLVYLVSQLMITPHLWLSSLPKLEIPDRMIFDLDPAQGVTFADVRWAAHELKKVLDELELPAFIMTTGSRGVHIVVPLKRVHTYEFVRTFAHDIAQFLVERYPDRLTMKMAKSKRGKRVFVDYLRNGFGATAVAPYAVRPIEKAPVATPFDWDELGSITPQKYTIRSIFEHLRVKKDPWSLFFKAASSLKKARKKLDLMCSEPDIK